MPNPFHGNRRRAGSPRVAAEIPTTVPTTEAIFLILRRMRVPLIVVVATFSFCTVGMMFMPGVDPDGNPHRLNIFDAFYQMTITLTTVGFTEAPYPFSYPQRMWMTMSIFLLVISWAYSIAVFIALIQSPAFSSAVATQQFRRQVRRLVEPFVILAGYGDAGRAVGADLDEHYRRFVVIDRSEERIESVTSGQLAFDVPAVQGDCATPAVLGMAGLGHRECEGVLALTDDDDTNLAVVMTTSLLRPDLPVLGRCGSHRTRVRMEHFSPGSAINADDRFGDYLALSIHQPVCHQLLRWLMDNDQEVLPPLRTDLAGRRWVFCTEGEFGEALAHDFAVAGIAIEVVAPTDEPDLSGALGFVVGTDSDIVNIAMAEQVRAANPDAYLVLRQQTNANKALLATLGIESVFIATEVVAREVLARILTAEFWSFVEHVLTRDDEWATAVRDHLLDRCGHRTPERDVITLSADEAPAAAGWLRRGRTLTLRDVMRTPDDRDTMLPVAAMVLMRDGEPQFFPPEDTALAVDDQVLLLGTPAGLSRVREVCHYLATVEYVATGNEVPLTWVWRKLTARRRSGT